MNIADLVYKENLNITDLYSAFDKGDLNYQEFKTLAESLFRFNVNKTASLVNVSSVDYKDTIARIDKEDQLNLLKGELCYKPSVDEVIGYINNYVPNVTEHVVSLKYVNISDWMYSDLIKLSEFLDNFTRFEVVFKITKVSQIESYFQKGSDLSTLPGVESDILHYVLKSISQLPINVHGSIMDIYGISRAIKTMRTSGFQILDCYVKLSNNSLDKVHEIVFDFGKIYNDSFMTNTRALRTYKLKCRKLFQNDIEYQDYINTIGITLWFKYIIKEYILQKDKNSQKIIFDSLLNSNNKYLEIFKTVMGEFEI